MFRRAILVGLLATAALGATGATPVAAKSTAVVVSGHCTGASVWKLKLSPEGSRIETEFQVDQNRNNRLWRITISDNGTIVWRGSRYTRAPSGSFTIHPLLANRAGTDRIVARATNVATGEVCRGVARASF
jgi:hypothetical protein